jgi:23S rRNA (cytidine1920-2'-O)/16S rRNA (cytidine1409-2'-O)-methyltransferase
MAECTRLDVLVCQQGLAPSRIQARALVLAGKIAVDGQRVTRVGTLIPTHAKLTRLGPNRRYVSRGGDKLAAALAAFPIRVAQCIAMDVGASTGGFTDCLLQRGAARVHAVDVGYGQLHWRLRTDSRVVVYERTNARYLRPQDIPERIALLTIDVSFISLRLLFPVLVELLASPADIVALIKPQFEVGKKQVGKGGVVRDPQLHEQALRDVLEAAQACGLSVRQGIVSPLLGPKGNREFLVHFHASVPSLPSVSIAQLCMHLSTGTPQQEVKSSPGFLIPRGGEG